MMIAGSTLTRVATPTTAKKSPPSEGIFGVPQTGVPGTNFDLSSDFSIFSPKCGQANIRSVFPESTGRGGTSRPDFPIGYPHMQIFCYF